MDAPAAWPRLPGTPRPERADASVSTLSGVGPALEKKLAKLGLRSVRDLLEHRPHRFVVAPEEPDRSRPGVGTDDRAQGRDHLDFRRGPLIAHADAPERAEALRKMVRERRPEAEIEIVTALGPVVGAHAGPGTVGLFWFDDS